MTSPSPAALTRSTPEGPPAPKRFRIRGIDLARGVAMLGMLAAHVGPSADDGTVVGSVMALAQGRSSILFATLAGVSLALMSGGRDIGASSRVAAQKIAVRAVLILALGTALVALGTPVKVILAYYGVFFLLSLPFLRLAPRTLFILAGATAVAGPIASMLLRSSAVVTGALAQIDRVDPIALLSGEGVTRLLLTGAYPAITWMPFLFVGLGLGRIGVERLRKVRLLVWGVGLMIVGYGGAFAARLLVPGAAPTWEASKKDFGSMLDKAEGAGMKPFGEGKPTGEVEWASLLSADQHTGAPLEIIGGVGAALVVIAASIWLSSRLPRLTWPIAAVGTMSLTVYTGHVLAINALGLSAMPGEPLWVLLAFAAVAAIFAVLWLRWFRRGPIESGMHAAVAWISERPGRR
ncbi:DUF418 domain-containing protein [Microbacterium sp. 5K110]|jgi:uncharacterized membrane protein YeiB|uniref:DUF418 domain-containing protein n=1 Tax=unclassified Microbacterium TaxID=2609290 RepID=UPI0010FEB0E9|nr:DUF418 domain-containing protein [Microbacterium sp. 5K110]TLF32952.1 DUF418 domain-containing protein [Microbacterium sp. 5K110]